MHLNSTVLSIHPTPTRPDLSVLPAGAGRAVVAPVVHPAAVEPVPRLREDAGAPRVARGVPGPAGRGVVTLDGRGEGEEEEKCADGGREPRQHSPLRQKRLKIKLMPTRNV